MNGDGWKCALDKKQNRIYYYHVKSRNTSWRRPTDFVDPPWREMWDESRQRHFYFNTQTRARSWCKPDYFRPHVPGDDGGDTEEEDFDSLMRRHNESSADRATSPTDSQRSLASNTSNASNTSQSSQSSQKRRSSKPSVHQLKRSPSGYWKEVAEMTGRVVYVHSKNGQRRHAKPSVYLSLSGQVKHSRKKGARPSIGGLRSSVTTGSLTARRVRRKSGPVTSTGSHTARSTSDFSRKKNNRLRRQNISQTFDALSPQPSKKSTRSRKGARSAGGKRRSKKPHKNPKRSSSLDDDPAVNVTRGHTKLPSFLLAAVQRETEASKGHSSSKVKRGSRKGHRAGSATASSSTPATSSSDAGDKSGNGVNHSLSVPESSPSFSKIKMGPLSPDPNKGRRKKAHRKATSSSSKRSEKPPGLFAPVQRSADDHEQPPPPPMHGQNSQRSPESPHGSPVFLSESMTNLSVMVSSPSTTDSATSTPRDSKPSRRNQRSASVTVQSRSSRIPKPKEAPPSALASTAPSLGKLKGPTSIRDEIRSLSAVREHLREARGGIHTALKANPTHIARANGHPVIDPKLLKEDAYGFWRKEKDGASGRWYYYNKRTNERSWKRPVMHVKRSSYQAEASKRSESARPAGVKPATGAAHTSSRVLVGRRHSAIERYKATKARVKVSNRRSRSFLGNWRQAYDPTVDKIYYYNSATKEVQWEPPAERLAPPAPASTQVTKLQQAGVHLATTKPAPNSDMLSKARIALARRRAWQEEQRSTDSDPADVEQQKVKPAVADKSPEESIDHLLKVAENMQVKLAAEMNSLSPGSPTLSSASGSSWTDEALSEPGDAKRSGRRTTERISSDDVSSPSAPLSPVRSSPSKSSRVVEVDSVDDLSLLTIATGKPLTLKDVESAKNGKALRKQRRASGIPMSAHMRAARKPDTRHKVKKPKVSKANLDHVQQAADRLQDLSLKMSRH